MTYQNRSLWITDEIRTQITTKTKNLVGVQPITTVIRSGRLKWYGHVMRKSDEDWVKKCMELELKAEDRLEDQEGHGSGMRTLLNDIPENCPLSE